MIKAIFFDCDGTLVPMDEHYFLKLYFNELCKVAAPFGYDPKKLIEVVTKSVGLMVQNKTGRYNSELFWDYFTSVFGEEKLKDREELFEEFYHNEFKNVAPSLGENKYAREIIDFCKENFSKVILTSQPVFPKQATIYRLSRVGLNEEDFLEITSYENSKSGKPNPSYFQEVLDRHNLKGEEVILFGNNSLEDGYCASQCGIKVFLIGDNLILPEGVEDNYEHLSYEEVIPTLKKYIG